MRLDMKDRRILAELDLHARASFQEIGKKAGLSKETTIYRVKRLEKQGVIQQYTTLIDFAKLGYTGFAVYSRFEKVTDGLKEEIVAYLQNIPELYWIALVGGKFDIVFGLMCKDVFSFNKKYYEILTRYGKHLVDNTIAIRTELRQHRKSYLLPDDEPLPVAPFFGQAPTAVELDALDADILMLLSNNARLPIRTIAELLRKPTSTVASRIRSLEREGIIQGYWTYLKVQKYGMQSYRLLLFLENMSEDARRKLFRYTEENPHALLSIETVGAWNFEITLEVEDQESLQAEIAKLRNTFSSIIKNVEFLIMFEDDLVYDPYPLKKQDRQRLGATRALSSLSADGPRTSSRVR